MKHGTREEVSRAYDLAMKQLAEKSLEDGMENYQLGHSCLVKKLTKLCKCDKILKEVFKNPVLQVECNNLIKKFFTGGKQKCIN